MKVLVQFRANSASVVVTSPVCQSATKFKILYGQFTLNEAYDNSLRSELQDIQASAVSLYSMGRYDITSQPVTNLTMKILLGATTLPRIV